MDGPLGHWPWEGPFYGGGDSDDDSRFWEKRLPKELEVGYCIVSIMSMAEFHRATGRGNPNTPGWMVDLEILDSGFGHFVYHVEKRFPDESTAEHYAGRLRAFVDTKTLDELDVLPKSGKIGMSKFERVMREDPSGYTTAFTHPDPLDPNDRVRQKTQGRSKGDGGKGTGHQGYPYDQPTMYGKEVGSDMGGSSYQVGGGIHPPPGDEQQPDRPLSVWDRLSDITDALDPEDDAGLRPVEIGPQGKGAATFGYGRNGLRDCLDPFEAEIDDLYAAFRASHGVRRPRPELMVLLVGDDAETEDGIGTDDTYDMWDPEEGP